MPTASSPLRLDADLVASAGLAAPAMSRSTAQQIAHWARIGRELERSPGVSLQAVAEVLAAEREYDSLSAQEQSVVRAFWSERMRALREGLRLDREYAASGTRYAELAEDGTVVVRGPSAGRAPTAKVSKIETARRRGARAVQGARSHGKSKRRRA